MSLARYSIDGVERGGGGAGYRKKVCKVLVMCRPGSTDRSGWHEYHLNPLAKVWQGDGVSVSQTTTYKRGVVKLYCSTSSDCSSGVLITYDIFMMGGVEGVQIMTAFVRVA